MASWPRLRRSRRWPRGARKQSRRQRAAEGSRTEGRVDLNQILHEAIVREASDVHLKVGLQPTVRIHGILHPLEDWSAISREDMAGILDVLLDEHHRERFRSRMQVDLAYQTQEF